MIDIAELKRLEAERTQGPYKIIDDNEVYSVLHGFIAGTRAYGGETDAAFITFMANNAKGIIEEIESLRMQLALAKEDHASDISIMRSIQSNHVTTAELELYKENARLREAAKGILAELDETGPGCADTVCPVWSVLLPDEVTKPVEDKED